MTGARKEHTTRIAHTSLEYPTLPPQARLSINRCNYPACILGGVTFQKNPSPLFLDGVAEFHRRFFCDHLPNLDDKRARAIRLIDYIDVAFRLFKPEELGYEAWGPEKRIFGTCFRLIRGWCFDSNGREGAVLKGWVESRFGLLARFHGGCLRDQSSDAFVRYLRQRTEGIFGTAALESQLDVLFSFSQYELALSNGPNLTLYRGISSKSEIEIIQEIDSSRFIVLLNNLTSFTSERERAEEFGYYILEASVPISKVFFYSRLIPNLLSGEDEFMVIGGLYEVYLKRY